MTARTDKDPLLWQILFWLVLPALVGVLFIYSHHSDVQNAKLAETRAALSVASGRLAAVDSELDDSAEAVKGAEQQMAALQSAHRSETEQLKAEHAAALGRLRAEHDARLAAMQQSHDESLRGLQDTLAKARQTAAEVTQELTGLREGNEALTADLEQHKASIVELNERLVALVEENHELSAKLAADDETIAGLNYELNAANQVEAALRDKLDRGAQRQERLQELVDKEEAAILDLKDKLVDLTREREALAERADAATKAVAGEPTQWRAELEQSQALIAALQSELEAAVREREDAEARLGEVSSSTKEPGPALQDANARIAALEEQIASLQQSLAERDAALAAANQAIAEAADERADDGADAARFADLTEQVAALQQQLAAAEEGNAQALAKAQAERTASVAEVQALYSDAAGLGGRLTPNGILLSLAGDELQFASGTANLPTGELPSLDRIAAFLRDKPSLTIRVEGHTDSAGSADINQRLSQERAEAVMQALIERGVAAERISAEGLGARRPIADNATDDGKRANRRVEVYAVPAESTIPALHTDSEGLGLGARD